MFKKSLAAVAVLAAFAGSAYAADVTMYGRVDLGLRFTNTDADKANVDDVNKFEMVSGNYTGSRFGIKGEEDLGNGMKVGFVLENGFTADDGSFSTEGKLFDRQSSLHLKGSFGEVAFGRMGIMNSTAGTFGIGQLSALGTGWGSVGDQNLIWGAGFTSRYDNMVTYATPEFAGAKVIAQYSFGKSHTPTPDDEDKTTQVEGKPTTDRYAGIGVTYNANNLALRAIVDTINKKSGDATPDVAAKYKDVDDTVRVTVGGSYDFGVVKPFLAASYFKDGTVGTMAGVGGNSGIYDGYGVMLGADAPLFGGTLNATVGYLKADQQGVEAGKKAEDIDRFIVGAGYEYKLSKRTVVYADAGYGQDDIDNKTNGGDKPSYFQAAFGMAHYF